VEDPKMCMGVLYCSYLCPWDLSVPSRKRNIRCQVLDCSSLLS